MNLSYGDIPIEIMDIGVDTVARIDVEEILLTPYPSHSATCAKFFTNYAPFEFEKEYLVRIKNDDTIVKCYVGNASNTLIQKDAGKRSIAEWHKAICTSKMHDIEKTIEVSINPPYSETKLDKIIEKINESQKFDSMFKIDFEDFFERHTRRELAHIAHQIINYLEGSEDEYKTD